LAAIFLLLSQRLSLDLRDNTGAGRRETEVTIRVNTYRRLDLLEVFLDYYTSHTCKKVIKQIQVVWSDQENKPPVSYLKKYPSPKVQFEQHDTNSLSNRFRALLDVPTTAVLSIDDDLIVPCEVIERNLRVWSSFKTSLVGFSPRMIAFDITSGATRYLRWQHTWWSGMYAVMLSKVSFLHRDYLAQYDKLVPKSFVEHIDNGKNCEDIAMAYVVAKHTNAAPVWVQGIVYEVSRNGISSGTSHFDARGECVRILKETSKEWLWVTGYQKVVPLELLDVFALTRSIFTQLST